MHYPCLTGKKRSFVFLVDDFEADILRCPLVTYGTTGICRTVVNYNKLNIFSLLPVEA